MSDSFRSSLDQLVSEDAEPVAELIEEEQDPFFGGEAGTTDLEGED